MTKYRVYHVGNGHFSVVSRHNTKEKAIEKCENLNEQEREFNNGKLDGGHYYQTDARDF